MSDWEKLKEECMNCRKCKLCETRTNVGFGVGKEDAEVLFIGEGPGEQEDLKGEPHNVIRNRQSSPGYVLYLCHT